VSALLLSARCVLAGVFLLAAAGKLLDLAGSRAALGEFGVPVRVAALAGVALPLCELAVAVALLIRPTAVAGAAGALVLLVVFIGGVARAMSQGRAPDCHCFGQIHSEPAGPATLARNAVLAAPALLILIAGSGPSLDGGLASLNGTQDALVATAVLALVLGLAAAAQWGDGRRLRRELATVIAAKQPPGLPRGAAAPAFTLAAIRGAAETLEELLNPPQPTILVFLSTRCMPCLTMLPKLADWQESLAGAVSLPAIFSGEHSEVDRIADDAGLSVALAQEGSEVFGLYALRATPSAVLIDADGAIAATPAEGVPAIEALIRSAAVSRPATQPAVSPA
jgi:thiol-disulfide isomerase/thioredoxin